MSFSHFNAEVEYEILARQREHNQKLPFKATPDCLFRIGQQCPIVNHAIHLWRRGDLPLENMLILAIAELHEANKLLIHNQLDQLRSRGDKASEATAP